MYGTIISYRWIYSTGFVTVEHLANFPLVQAWLGFQDDFGNLVQMNAKHGKGRLQYINNGVLWTYPPAIRRAEDYGM